MNKQEIEELKKNVNIRLEKSKYRDSYVDVFGKADVMLYIEWMWNKTSNKDKYFEYDPIWEKLDEFPSFLDWRNEEYDSLAIIIGDFIESKGSPFVELTITFNGKNISGVKFPIDYLALSPNAIIDNAKALGETADIFTRKYIFTSVIDDNCQHNKYWTKYFQDLFTKLKDIKQIAARIEMSAALFGDKLVDQALEKCGVMNLKELRYAAED